MSALYCELKFHCDLLSYVEPLILLNFCLIPAGTVTLAILNDKKLPNGIEIESDGVNPTRSIWTCLYKIYPF